MHDKIKTRGALLGVGVLIGVVLDSVILRPMQDPLYAKEANLPAYREIQTLPFACRSDPRGNGWGPLDELPEVMSAASTRGISAPQAKDGRNLADCC